MPEDVMMVDAPAAPDDAGEIARLQKECDALRSKNEALKKRATQEMRMGNRTIRVEDYFHAYKMIKEGRIDDALFEMEKILDDTAGSTGAYLSTGWRGWI